SPFNHCDETRQMAGEKKVLLRKRLFGDSTWAGFIWTVNTKAVNNATQAHFGNLGRWRTRPGHQWSYCRRDHRSDQLRTASHWNSARVSLVSAWRHLVCDGVADL